MKNGLDCMSNGILKAYIFLAACAVLINVRQKRSLEVDKALYFNISICVSDTSVFSWLPQHGTLINRTYFLPILTALAQSDSSGILCTFPGNIFIIAVDARNDTLMDSLNNCVKYFVVTETILVGYKESHCHKDSDGFLC